MHLNVRFDANVNRSIFVSPNEFCFPNEFLAKHIPGVVHVCRYTQRPIKSRIRYDFFVSFSHLDKFASSLCTSVCVCVNVCLSVCDFLFSCCSVVRFFTFWVLAYGDVIYAHNYNNTTLVYSICSVYIC